MKHTDIGKKFGRLTCVGYGPNHVAPSGKTNRTMRCQCECGGAKTALAVSIRAGRTTSCGCVQRAGNSNVIHGCGRRGNARHPLYSLWGQMRSRCSNPATTGYANYGGRGIKCCLRWADFLAFAADMGPRPNGYTLDRIDVNGDYEPNNCRWASRATQANNTTRTVRLCLDGESLTLLEVAARFGLKANTLRTRLHRGWALAEAIQP
jgi:hypothetical protein